MTQMPGNGVHRLLRRLMTYFVIGIPLLPGGCASPGGERVILHQRTGEVVVLEPLIAAIQARHPIAMEPAVVDRVLRAVHVQQEERLLQRLLAGTPPPVRVFSDEQVGLLAPLVVAGFSRATPNQQLRVRLPAPNSPVQDATQGVFYFSESSLYFTLLQYPRALHVSQDRPGRQLPDPTGLQGRRLVFLLPGIRNDGDARSRLVEERPPATLIFNYDRLREIALAALPGAPATRDDVVKADEPGLSAPRRIPTPAEGHEGAPGSEITASRPQHNQVQDSGSLQELIVRKDLEIEGLKDELRRLRQAYDAQQLALKRLKQRKRQESAPRN